MRKKTRIVLKIVLGLVIIVLLCPRTLFWNGKSQREYRNMAHDAIGTSDWISIDLIVDFQYNGKYDGCIPYHVYYHYGKNDPAFYISYFDDLEFIKIGLKSASHVSFHNQTIEKIDKLISMQDCYLSRRNDAEAKIQFMPYYTQVLPKTMRCSQFELKMSHFVDTLIRNEQKKLFIGTTQKRFLADKTNGDFNIPLQYECETWINALTNQIDSVIAYNISDNDFSQKITYKILHISFDDMSHYFDSIFDFDQPMYENFTILNDIHTRNYNNAQQELNTETLSFPIINLEHDTTTISLKSNWILLDLWMFGCGGCNYGFETFKKERDSLGYRIIENQGIEIVSVNALSDNYELISEFAEKYDCLDIVYSAKGINKKLALVNYGFPSYYLISPDKQIVWRSNYLGDYSELLKAKADYEKQHQKE